MLKRKLILFLAVCVMLQSISFISSAAPETPGEESPLTASEGDDFYLKDYTSYQEYLLLHEKDTEYAGADIVYSTEMFEEQSVVYEGKRRGSCRRK